MQIDRNKCLIEVPEGWRQTNSENLDYFESPDGVRGAYITFHTKIDFPDDKKLVQFVLDIERKKAEGMSGYKFKNVEEKNGVKNQFTFGYLDQYDKSKNYRIVSKVLVKNHKIFHLPFHDYDCTDYKVSKITYQTLIDSFCYNSEYLWLLGINVTIDTKKKVFVGTEDGFIDIDMFVDQSGVNADGSIVLRTNGSLNGTDVGFELIFENAWKEKPLEGSNGSLFWGKGIFLSLAEKSENFVRELARLYGYKIKNVRKIESMVDVVGLSEHPGLMDTKLVPMKVFFNSDIEDLYAEIYVNIDLKSRVLEFHEKSPEYRMSLLKSLGAET